VFADRLGERLVVADLSLRSADHLDRAAEATQLLLDRRSTARG